MTEKFGWCLSNQHSGDPSVPEYSQCPGQQWNLICPCECHDKNPGIPIPPPMKQRPAAPRQKPAPKTETAIPTAGKKPKQRRKLL